MDVQDRIFKNRLFIAGPYKKDMGFRKFQVSQKLQLTHCSELFCRCRATGQLRRGVLSGRRATLNNNDKDSLLHFATLHNPFLNLNSEVFKY